MDVSSHESGEESDISQGFVCRRRGYFRGGRRRGRKIRVRARSNTIWIRGGRERRGRRLGSRRLSSRGESGRAINSGSSGSTTHLSAATLAVLNEIGYPRMEEGRTILIYSTIHSYILEQEWVDKRSMYFLTTIHIGERIRNSTVKRRQADGTQADIPCPPCIPDYQRYMRV